MAFVLKKYNLSFWLKHFFQSKVLFVIFEELHNHPYCYFAIWIMETNNDESVKFSQEALVIRQMLYVKTMQV